MTAKELFKIAKQNGFVLKRISGSHYIYAKEAHIVPIPFHAGRDAVRSKVGDIMNYIAKITKEDGEYLVSFPDKPNINTCGESLEHALEMAEEALNETLICELDAGKHLIVPKTKENAKKGLYAIPVKPEIEIAYMIFEARKGKPIEKVAKEAGISKQAYRSFETPFANPALNTLSDIAKALGKNLEVRLV